MAVDTFFARLAAVFREALTAALLAPFLAAGACWDLAAASALNSAHRF